MIDLEHDLTALKENNAVLFDYTVSVLDMWNAIRCEGLIAPRVVPYKDENDTLSVLISWATAPGELCLYIDKEHIMIYDSRGPLNTRVSPIGGLPVAAQTVCAELLRRHNPAMSIRG